MKKNQKIILVDAYHCLFTDSEINKEMQKVLNDFIDMQKIILTNASGEKLDFLEKYKPKNYELFTLYGNPRKTDGGYYERLLKTFETKAEDCIYIEHSLDAIEKAEKVGIKSFHYQNDLELLEKFIKENI